MGVKQKELRVQELIFRKRFCLERGAPHRSLYSGILLKRLPRPVLHLLHQSLEKNLLSDEFSDAKQRLFQRGIHV